MFDELLNRVNTVGYFGIPKDMDHEGIIKGTKDLCHLRPKLGVMPSPDCVSMRRTFYLQVTAHPLTIGVRGYRENRTPFNDWG